MKKLTLILCLLLAACMLFAACDGGTANVDDNDGDPIVTLTENEIALAVGETYTISYSVSPELPVEFVSSDSAVAAVDASGVVTAVSNGTASISVSAGDYSKGYLKVTVSTPSMAAVPNLLLSTNAVDILVGSDFDLTAEVTVGADVADAAVTWESDNPTVVTVADGKISALTEGQATVTATADVNGKTVSAVCDITVYEHYDISLSVSTQEVPLNGTVTVTAEVFDMNGNPITPAAGELEYYSTTPDFVSISGNTFTILNNAAPTVGVRYKGNIRTVPISVYSIQASAFSDSCTDYFGTVSDVTFCGVYFHSNAYQPTIYLTAEGVAEIKAYAEAHGYQTLSIHAYSGIFDNAFFLNGKYYLPKDAWGSCDVPVSELSETFAFWSQSQGATDIYMWFDFK